MRGCQGCGPWRGVLGARPHVWLPLGLGLSCCASAVAPLESSSPGPRPRIAAAPRPLHTACSQPVTLWILLCVFRLQKPQEGASIWPNRHWAPGHVLKPGCQQLLWVKTPSLVSPAVASALGRILRGASRACCVLGGAFSEALMSRTTPVVADPQGSLGQRHSSAAAEADRRCETRSATLPLGSFAQGLWGSVATTRPSTSPEP